MHLVSQLTTLEKKPGEISDDRVTGHFIASTSYLFTVTFTRTGNKRNQVKRWNGRSHQVNLTRCNVR
jgi:hypothetical protein